MRPARGHWPAVAAAALAAAVALTPGFTVGALAGPMEAELGVSRTTIGLAMSAFYAATALGSPFAERLAARLPVPVSLAAAAVGAAIVLLTLSLTTSTAVLFTVLIAGGLTNGLVQPAAARLLLRRPRPAIRALPHDRRACCQPARCRPSRYASSPARSPTAVPATTPR